MLNRLALAFVLTLGVFIIEVAGGLWSGSLALLSDAGHAFSDLMALGLSWYGLKQAERPSNIRMTYGYHRVGIFVAFVNAATLIGIALIVLVEAYRRFTDPQPVLGEVMFSVATVGLMVNLVIIAVLRSHLRNLNVRSAFLHVMGDTLASVAVIAGAVIILLTGWYGVDSVASILIAGIIMFGSLRILRESLNVLLEATPGGVDIAEIVRDMNGVSGIRDVHHLHVWAITPEIRALSCHVSVEDITVSQSSSILSGLNELLERRHAIGHSTIQLECEGCDPNELYCSLSPEGEPHTPVGAH